MSRHRDVRSMKYSDEYDGYDDVYGHSVDDDYNVSPEAEEFLFDRNKQQNISSFLVEPAVAKSNESVESKEQAPNKAERAALSEKENAQLKVCMETVRNVIGDSVLEEVLVEKVIQHNFNAEAVLNDVLNETPPKETSMAKEHLEAHAGFSENIPPSSSKRIFATPKFAFGGKRLGQTSPASNNSKTYGSLTDLITSHAKTISSKAPFVSKTDETKRAFGTLADLTAHHLQKSDNSNGVVRTSLFSKGLPSPKTNFVIPKLSRSRGNGEFHPTPSTFRLADPLEPPTIPETSDPPIEEKEKENLRLELEKMSVDGSPITNNWTIDLTTALRSSESKSNQKFIKKEEKMSEDRSVLENSIASTSPTVDHEQLNIYVDMKYSIPGEGCKLNLSYLQNVKLRYSHKTASSFGRMLCKRWQSRKPYVVREKSIINEKIKRFDFSTPSPDFLVLTHLRRR